MSLNVLVVDDSAVVRQIIGKTLQLAGVPVGRLVQASNGREGLDVLESEWIDLVLADLNMPVMDGEQMIRFTRSNPAWADLPIIIVSTEGSETRIAKLMDPNTRFIHKPFTPETVRRVVFELIGAAHEQPAAEPGTV